MVDVKNYFKQADSNDDNTLILDGSVETSSGANLKSIRVTTIMTDVSATGSSAYVTLGVPCRVIGMSVVLSTQNISVADSILKMIIGGVDVVGGEVTLVQPASAGDVFNPTTPVTADNVLTATDALQIESDGGSVVAANAQITVEFELL